MVPPLLSLLALSTIALAAFGLGRPILRGLGVGQDDRLSVAVWSVALGLITWGILLLGLGLVGGLYVPAIGVLTMVACLWGIGEFFHRRFCLAAGWRPKASWWDGDVVLRSNDRQDDTPWGPPARWLCRGVLLAAVVAAIGSLLAAMAPPTAGDALCYHLDLPKTFLAEHQVAFLPHNDNSTFPLLVEMWYLWALALEGGVSAQLVHWAMGILLSLAAVVLATPILGRRWAWIVGAVVLLTPGVNNQMTAPLNDVALAALTTLALAALWQAVVGEAGRRWYLLAGLMLGGALGIKYVALVFAAALSASWIWALTRRPGQRRVLIEGAAIAAVVAASVGGLWYARAAWHRGNPVFPMLAEVFGERPTAIPPRETLPASKSPLGRGPVGFATAPWQVTMHPERFGGRGHQLGVLLLAAVPGMLVARRLRGLGMLLGVALGYSVFWYLLRQNVRFLFPVVPPLAIAVVWVWIEIRRFPSHPRRLVTVAFGCVVVAMAVVGFARGRDRLAVAVGLEDRESYLTRHEPSYRAAAVYNALAAPDDHLLSQDYRSFYFNGQVTRENVYRRYMHYDQDIDAPEDLGRRLRDAGFTHLLLTETLGDDGIEHDTTLSRLADVSLGAGDNDLLPLIDYCATNSDGTTRRYRLVTLRSPL